MDKEERELTIKIDQFNAKLQIDLAWALGLLASTIALWIFGYQYLKENESVSYLAWGMGTFFAVVANVWTYRVRKCRREFEKLK